MKSGESIKSLNKPSWVGWTAILSLFTVHLVFSAKYLVEYFPNYPSLFIATILPFAMIYILTNNRIFAPNFIYKLDWIWVISLIIVAVVFKYTIPEESLGVDRYSLIVNFLDHTFEGKYPYFATSHLNNYPTALPGYFVLAWPFYAMDMLTLLSALGYIIFFLYCNRKYNTTPSFVRYSIYAVLTIAALWEIASRSNVFTYTVLSVILLDHIYEQSVKDQKPYIYLGLGFMLSSRPVMILAYVYTFVHQITHNTKLAKRIIALWLFAVFSFFLTFAYIVIPHYNEFLNHNSFTIQQDYFLPNYIVALNMILAGIIGFICKNSEEALGLCGILVLISVLTHIANRYAHNSIQWNVWDSIPISYFIMASAFFSVYLFKYFAQSSTTKQYISY